MRLIWYSNLFVDQSYLRYVEIGFSNEGPNGTKERQDRSMKTLMIPKAFCIRIVDQCPTADKKHLQIGKVV